MVSFPIPYWCDLTVLNPDSLLGTHGEEAYVYLLSGQERPKPSPASGECLHPAGGMVTPTLQVVLGLTGFSSGWEATRWP